MKNQDNDLLIITKDAYCYVLPFSSYVLFHCLAMHQMKPHVEIFSMCVSTNFQGDYGKYKWFPLTLSETLNRGYMADVQSSSIS